MTKVTEQYSVSHGTMRPEDLIPALISELEDRQNENLYTTDGDELYIVKLNEKITNLLSGIEKRQSEEGYYDSEESGYDLEELFDMLNEFAGEGLYFGAHYGDGSEYGYWSSAINAAQ